MFKPTGTPISTPLNTSVTLLNHFSASLTDVFAVSAIPSLNPFTTYSAIVWNSLEGECILSTFSAASTASLAHFLIADLARCAKSDIPFSNPSFTRLAML